MSGLASKKRRPGLNSHLILAIAAGSLGSSFQHGYNTGVLNNAQEIIQDFINVTYTERFNENPDKATKEFIYSIITAIFCVGGMVGALMTAFFAERFGRRGGLLINNIFVFIAAILMSTAKYCQSYEMLAIGRFFYGINSGLATGLAPMYLTEISPTHLRGAIGTIYQLILVLSILISNILSIPSFLGTPDSWPYLFVITLIPTIFMLITLPMCPESPKHIFIVQGREIAAQKALTWLRGTIEVYDEMDEMKTEYETVKLVPKVTLSDMWKNPNLREPMIISIVVMLSQQFSGINAAIFFSSAIFEDAGLDKMQSMYSTLGMGCVNLIMTLVSLILIERCGRRTLHLTGLAGMGVTTIILTFCIELSHIKFMQFLSVAAVFVFIIMFATGPGSIPWFLVAELFGIGARPVATTIAVAVNWSANFIIGLCFLPIKNIVHGYVFLIFTALLSLFWVYTYKRVPETKGKTADEIAALFRQKAYQ